MDVCWLTDSGETFAVKKFVTYTRKIYGRVLVNGQWRNGCSQEICNLYKEMELARTISFKRLHSVGYVMRMKDDRLLKKTLKEYVEGTQDGRPGRR